MYGRRHYDFTGAASRLYYPDPDYGIFVTTAADPAGPWSQPALVEAGRGLIDPCPFWDDDGTAYLVHGWARSRAGINNLLTLQPMDRDGNRTLGAGRTVIDANQLPGWKTLEGPKLYKRAGWYYVMAPAGGVTAGYQAVFRARVIGGPVRGPGGPAAGRHPGQRSPPGGVGRDAGRRELVPAFSGPGRLRAGPAPRADGLAARTGGP